MSTEEKPALPERMEIGLEYILGNVSLYRHDRAYVEAMLKDAVGEGKWTTAAAIDVMAERRRQIEVEEWTPEHDDGYDSGELAGAASCYAAHVNGRQWIFPDRPDDYQDEPAPDYWPWDADWWKPKSPREDLVRAAAMLLAEIERLDRATAAAQVHGQ